ncbi:hypothetical protein ES707_20581 [subsurface metagenome]
MSAPPHCIALKAFWVRLKRTCFIWGGSISVSSLPSKRSSSIITLFSKAAPSMTFTVSLTSSFTSVDVFFGVPVFVKSSTLVSMFSSLCTSSIMILAFLMVRLRSSYFRGMDFAKPPIVARGFLISWARRVLTSPIAASFSCRMSMS